MDELFKGLLTAGTVVLVMAAARHGGRRVAGLVAALPTITAPTLAWLAHDEGMAFAISAAIGSVAACAMLAVFALGYARAARYGGGAIALVCGLGGAVAMALPAKAASADLSAALMLALGSCAITFVAMPRLGAEIVSRQRARCSMWLVAAMAGGLTAIATLIGPAMGGFAAGLLSSLPLITGPVAMAEHANGGHRAAAHFLRGYVGGLFGKAAFGTVFVLLAPRTGAIAALTLACACACLLSTVRLRLPPPGASPWTLRPSRRTE
ncbi:hypothetical protein [Mitsuaria sp. 7]|uniref:hypothetical protein n=1 Tax=Mitsuaria sp. 7 TaxID=1658665 RepID=UPI0007DCC469|nr:hypothetical protein [Mitsuaria sp. 7]ANH67149.1 hypothetical protein ABE85_05405 [Mitsuaria sp. 7]